MAVGAGEVVVDLLGCVVLVAILSVYVLADLSRVKREPKVA